MIELTWARLKVDLKSGTEPNLFVELPDDEYENGSQSDDDIRYRKSI